MTVDCVITGDEITDLMCLVAQHADFLIENSDNPRFIATIYKMKAVVKVEHEGDGRVTLSPPRVIRMVGNATEEDI